MNSLPGEKTGMMHFGKDEIAEFLAGRLDAAGRRRMVQHFLSGCPLCRRRLEPLLGEEPWRAAEPVAEELYDEVLNRAGATARSLTKRWKKEFEKLERALALLDQVPGGPGDLRFPYRQAQALHGWPLCEALLQKSYEARFSDPKRMLNLAESAASVATNIRLEKYPWPGFVADLQARAFAELGNAYRLNLRFNDAEGAFEKARNFLEQGTSDPLSSARVLDLEASLRSSQRRLDDAISLLDQVHRLYMEAGDQQLAGRALISKGINTRCQGSPREAVALLETGLSLLRVEGGTELISIGQQALLDALADCGEYQQASRLLLRSGLREAFADEPINLLKLRWVEGKIHAGLGRLDTAERAFSQVRQEFLRLGQFYEAALVGIELAAVWLQQGRATEVQELATEMHEIFDELGVEREAAKAFYFIREACRSQVVNLLLIERIRAFLEQLPWRPGARFEPAAFTP
jgi:tetratricopeptide (TPR) repeat protein